ncbi:hypothetical protein HDF26_000623 [Pedobacter cryoconitis]|uniref:YXWGXW repeat-containing protein n=1 Tax=Pedobacter cryoconitis TaxID=188932 RepID=A0A7W8ZRU3_9SPHI|nr:hypothetical protein [Pedobacter cryoconitis]MBB5638795.1 hypothetical protein [Pedobacter cryoconitis]MBB6270196.1 hypothetical protein [Pedobacter cryoconitis]
MKKLLLIAAIGIASLAVAPVAKAQVSLSINIGSQPQWGPRGYNHVDYYYLPDVDSYYYVPTRQFVYLSGNRWIHARSLPSRYRGYDLYGGRKVVINNYANPWTRHNYYRTQYVSNNYYSRPSRVVVRNNYRSERNYDRGRGNGWGHGNNGNHWGNGNNGNNRGRGNDRGGRGDHGDRNHGGDRGGDHGRGRGGRN